MHASILYRKKIGIIYLIVWVLLLILLAYFQNSKLFGLFLLIFFAILFILQKFLFKKFTRKALIQIYPDHFSVEIVNGEKVESKRVFHLVEIAACSIAFPTKKFSAIKFLLKNNETFEWCFYQNRQGDEEVIGLDLIKQFIDAIHKYNSSVNKIDKIVFSLPFWTTKSGLFRIVGLLAFFLIIAFLLPLNNNTFPQIALASYAVLAWGLIVRRKADLAYYKKMDLSSK
jgi:hypothetical protein